MLAANGDWIFNFASEFSEAKFFSMTNEEFGLGETRPSFFSRQNAAVEAEEVFLVKGQRFSKMICLYVWFANNGSRRL